MPKSPPKKETINVRGAVSVQTHKALKVKQSHLDIETGSRPQMTEVVAQILNDWAQRQAA